MSFFALTDASRRRALARSYYREQFIGDSCHAA